MHSAIYRGILRHRRFHPRNHEFSYKSTLFFIDLDELPQLFSAASGWSYNGKSLGCFRRTDYLGDANQDLKAEVRAEVTRQLNLIGQASNNEQANSTRRVCPQGPIRMLTNLRMWGFCFNPVTLYYLFHSDAQQPALILAQVNNTPWNERHCYLIACDEATGKTGTTFAKQFHVSPFNPLAMDYHWVSTTPDKSLLVHMENYLGDVRHMDATLTLEREAWSAEALRKILWQQPWLTIKIPLAIYWQAIKLLVKRVPIYSHPPVAVSKISKIDSSGKISPGMSLVPNKHSFPIKEKPDGLNQSDLLNQPDLFKKQARGSHGE